MKQKELHQWYYVVGIEIAIDRHHFPRVVCNLVCNVDGWKGEFAPKLSAVGKFKNVRPVKERTFLAKRRNVLKT